MLQSLTIRGFKSLYDVRRLELAPLTLFFGPNAAGKSNLIDSILLLSRLGTERTLADALGTNGPLRGRPIEAFSFPPAGLPGLFEREDVDFTIDADLRCGSGGKERYEYRVQVIGEPSSGEFRVGEEFLAKLKKDGTPWSMKPIMETRDDALKVRKRGSSPGRPENHPKALNHTLVSDERFSGKPYAPFELVRSELASFDTYYLDPRSAMRWEEFPQEARDIGPMGERLAAFLYRLHQSEPKVFAAIQRTLCTVIPSIDDLAVDLDTRRGTIDIEITQSGIPFSGRIVSEGTLRVLALICVTLNPWGGSLLAFEEPENGVHPRRIELVAEMLGALALDADGRTRQVVLTSHSPLFCGRILQLARRNASDVRMYRVVREKHKTRFIDFDPDGPLFRDAQLMEALSSPGEDGVFEALALRGLLDG